MRPLLKWPGGKGGELARILRAMPSDVERYFEPFVGGGAAFFAMPATIPALINDVSADLMDLYARVQREDRRLPTLLEQLDAWWQALERFTAASARPLVEAFMSLRSTSEGRVEPPASLGHGVAERLRSTVPCGWSDLAEGFVAVAARTVPTKLLRMREVERQRRRQLPETDVWANIEGAFKASCYTVLRSTYNRGRRSG
ncbi:MAG: DNA adenine methylase, partial [Actinomycetota bacterium]